MTYLEDLEKIVKINSYTKNKAGVDNVSKYMTKWLLELGFTHKIFKRKKIGNHNLYTTKKTKGKKILLLGHNDTVFPPNTFESFKEDEKYIYGPGVCDMKGGNIVALQALRNIYKKNKQIRNIDFFLVSDEESGSDDSKLISKKIAKNYDICLVFEAAGKNLEVVTARKGVGTFNIKCKGKASHAGTSYTKGIDANHEASYKMQKLIALTDLKKGTTVNVGKVEGGIGANIISPYSELLLEIRFSSTEEKDRLLNNLKEITHTSYIKGTKSKLNGLIQRDVMQENQKQLDFIKELEKITQTKIKTEHRGGVSDANIFSSCNVITIDGLGPYGLYDHTKKEKALKSSFEQRIDFITKTLLYFQK
ncbi:peptidase M20 [Malaciobacter molluscorum LMG 25693]|uniref:Peptidase M20 n=1 Tax=Malaciobacter molluscorum LMG 25693 TaxID=870501 RepID=A0A2G1DI52_9BACT|nr:M20 family metallopeptidase [Malaciobacter molluscorum]AXX92360.1 glutamate carboxypeptidase, peptidase M20 family [Malaciobacter molluscorum LMG 25693]PHO18189.1 peptidase M20 [Malaciobacter molluscorum LMG 25693]